MKVFHPLGTGRRLVWIILFFPLSISAQSGLYYPNPGNSQTTPTSDPSHIGINTNAPQEAFHIESGMLRIDSLARNGIVTVNQNLAIHVEGTSA